MYSATFFYFCHSTRVQVKRSALQVKVVRLDILRTLRCNHGSAHQGYFERFDHRCGNFILHLENINDLPVIGFRSNVIAVIRTHELGRDA
jgi:hypothetical protein